MRIYVSQPLTITAHGTAHAPYIKFELELCALLFQGGDLLHFTGTSQWQPNSVRGVTLHERTDEQAALTINVKEIDPACTSLVVAAHIEEAEGPLRCNGNPVRINPTVRHLTHSVRALGFGHSATFNDEDVVYGVALLTLERSSHGWRLDDTQRPANYPELAKFARRHGVELTPFGA